MVGRLVPNKGHAALLEAFAFYQQQYNPRNHRSSWANTMSAGGLSAALQGYAQELGVGSAVEFVGGVSDAELKAHYQIADVFLLTSRHEGFCVPLVEAMVLRLPDRGTRHHGSTRDGGRRGLVWPEADAALLAASIDRVVRDRTLREQLAGRRLATLSGTL